MNQPTHAELVKLAARWLEKSQRCSLIVAEFHCVVNCEQPDAIGWNCGAGSVLVECKANRADFLRDRFKPHRYSSGLGQRRYYMCPEGVITPADLDTIKTAQGWGLVVVKSGRARMVKRATPRGNNYDQRGERCLLVNIARKASNYLPQPFAVPVEAAENEY